MWTLKNVGPNPSLAPGREFIRRKFGHRLTPLHWCTVLYALNGSLRCHRILNLLTGAIMRYRLPARSLEI